MSEVSYQLFSPENSHVNIFQRAVIVLKHLSRPQGTVHMGPIILTDVQQPASLLKINRHVISDTKTFLSASESPNRFLTHISVLISILQTQNTLPVVTNAWRRRKLWAIFTV